VRSSTRFTWCCGSSRTSSSTPSALLWFRALLQGPGQTSRSAAWIALAICLVCALVDETHQATIPTRSGSVRDLVVDASGAAGVLILARGRREARERAQMHGTVAVEPAE